MAVSNTLRIFPEQLRSLVAASISPVYSGIGNPLEFPARIIEFQNSTNVDLFISWDGINDHQFIPSNSFVLLDVSSNKVNDQGWYVPKYQRFYVREVSSPATSGSIYVTAFYGINEGT